MNRQSWLIMAVGLVLVVCAAMFAHVRISLAEESLQAQQSSRDEALRMVTAIQRSGVSASGPPTAQDLINLVRDSLTEAQLPAKALTSVQNRGSSDLSRRVELHIDGVSPTDFARWHTVLQSHTRGWFVEECTCKPMPNGNGQPTLGVVLVLAQRRS